MQPFHAGLILGAAAVAAPVLLIALVRTLGRAWNDHLIQRELTRPLRRGRP